MLAYILGLVVGTSSLLILVKAVLAKDRQQEANLFQTDIFWSGVGLFYGLALWVCAERITGALLLGQIASVCLIGWLVVQVKDMRLAADGISPSPNSNFITDLFRKPEPATELTLTEVAEELEETVEESEIIEAEIETATEETEELEEVEEVELSASTEDIPLETEATQEESEEEVIEYITAGAEITPEVEEVTKDITPEAEITPEVDNEIEEVNPATEDSAEEEIDTDIEVPTSASEPVAKQEPEVEAKKDVEENKTKEADSEKSSNPH